MKRSEPLTELVRDFEPRVLPDEGRSFTEYDSMNLVVGLHDLGEGGFPRAVGAGEEARVRAFPVEALYENSPAPLAVVGELEIRNGGILRVRLLPSWFVV